MYAPNVLPFFLTYNTCEGQFDGIELSGCFAGAYHSATLSNQPYLNAPWEGFAPDVLILSHELGETLGDPFTNNQSPCSFDTFMEVGDPVESFQMSLPFAGRTYTAEDLVFFDWFTANYPPQHSVNDGYTFEESYLFPRRECYRLLTTVTFAQTAGTGNPSATSLSQFIV